jgi:hypothetical protein
MTLEQQQVTIQELSRLNEAINTTMHCLSRIVPQLAMLQWQQQQPLPFQSAQPFGFGPQIGFPTQPWVDPVSQAFVQGHAQALRSILTQPGVPGYSFTQQPYGIPHPLAFGMPQTPFAQFQRSF